MKRLCAVAAAIMFAVISVFAENTADTRESDVQSSSDYPLVQRCPGSVISHYARQEDATYSLPLSPMKKGLPAETQQLFGRIFRITYNSPEKWATSATYDSFVRTLKKAGFRILFTSSGKGLAKADAWVECFYKDCDSLRGETREQRFLTAKLTAPGGDIYATLYVSLGWYTHAVAQLDVIEEHKR